MVLDLSLNPDLYVSNVWEAAAQEIDLLFYTNNTELIGNPQFGTNFEEFLWTLIPTTRALSDYIDNKLRDTNFASKLEHTLEVTQEVDENSMENVYRIKITLFNDYQSIAKTYRMSEKL